MRSTRFTFSNANGEQLSARLDFPLLGKPRAYALFAHCFTCSKNLNAVAEISRALNQKGVAVLRFDFTGLGQSKGDFADSNFSSNISDLKAAYDELSKNYEAPQILIGHSLGGAAVLHAAKELDSVKCVATIGAPFQPTHVAHLIDSKRSEIEETGEAVVNIGGRPFKVKKQFLEDLQQHDSPQKISGLDAALLVMHSPQDSTVGVESAEHIYVKAKHPKSFVTLDGADHLLTRKEDANYVGRIIAEWASRYIVENTPVDAPEGEVWARVGSEGYTTEITAGSHHLVADEPLSVGGKDEGPTPYGYLLAGLGACTAMTLRMYADFKKIDLEEVKVFLTHDKVHVEDSQGEKSGGKIDQIVRNIEIQGNLTEQERARLIEIADRCPVHKTIEGKPQIITTEKK